ncbi:hypothetical protein KSP40_PGU012469 [Platanthera guangdongensis]|uniref:Uncharacterized protein n=1 Tax=Platanthera guangdongensis TaxID=2320717 RepID=A0ABR2LPL6_9ASPA
MQPLLSSDSSKSFAMTPSSGHRRRFLPSVPPTRALFSALRFLRLRFRLHFLLCFPSGLYLLLHSSTHSSDSNSFLSRFLLVLVISSGVVLLLYHVLLFFRVLPLSATFPLLVSSIRAFSSWIRSDCRTGLAVKPSGKYEGDWIDSKCDGDGVETWNKGSRYVGQFKNGLRHDFGVYRNHTDDLYAGEWLNGQSHGYGEHISWLNGQSRNVGEFKRGLKQGLGHCHFRNGDTYAGEYFADKMHGFGVYHFADGRCYERAWREGKREGLGMYSSVNGESQSGHWANDVLEIFTLRIPSPALPSPSTIPEYSMSFRAAAERAYNVQRVDVRVKKVVAAADNAANAAAIAGSKAVLTEKRDRGVEYLHDFPMQIV